MNNQSSQDLKFSPSTKLIFIIDDEDIVVEFLKHYLEFQGFKVDFAYDGISGLEKIKTLKPDLIILDAMLPKKSGYELVKLLQQNFELKKIPIIVITGKFHDIDTQRMFLYEPNVKEFILKPIQPDHLIAKIHMLLHTQPKEEMVAEEKAKKFKEKYEQ